MKKSNLTVIATVLSSLIVSNPVWSRGHGGGFRGHPGVGFSLGYGFGYGPFGGYSPYWGYGGFSPYRYDYAYPPIITVPSTPPVYIQRNVVPPPEPNYWYYCRNAGGYYPYIRDCPGGWEKVAPQPSVR